MRATGTQAAGARARFLRLAGLLALLSALGLGLALHRVSEVNDSLEAVNRVAAPFGKLIAQMQADAEVFRRELDRALGSSHWSDPRWKARPLPAWIGELLANELERGQETLKKSVRWPGFAGVEVSRWRSWLDELALELERARAGAHETYQTLASPTVPPPTDADSTPRVAAPKAMAPPLETYAAAASAVERFSRKLQWGAVEYEQVLGQVLYRAQGRVRALETGLEILLVVALLLSAFVFWLWYRALEPLSQLTVLAREIAERGIARADMARLPEARAGRGDEVAELTREFRRMAVALLERGREVEEQRKRLEEQNRELREMGEIRERLRHAESLAAIGRMSAQVAHEVRNPLHSIGLEAEIAIESLAAAGSPQARQALASIQQSVERLDGIVGNYLRLSKLSSGSREEFDLGDAVETVLATYASLLETRRIRVDWTRETASPRVHADRALVEHALSNLLRNAIQALDAPSNPDGEEPSLRLRIHSPRAGRAAVTIEDNGPGIPRALLGKLFTPFVTGRAEGTGLGLAFVRKVAEDHEGSAFGFNRADGGGAIFRFELPMATRNAELSHSPGAG